MSSEKSLINDLKKHLREEEGQSAETVNAKDETELAFGIAEVATIVAITKGIGELVKMLIDFRSKMGSNKQKLHLKTALGSTVVELSAAITPEELKAQLEEIISSK